MFMEAGMYGQVSICTDLMTCVFQLLQYISDSGGVLGLWFGFAIMTFIEFFEFFVDFALLTVNKVCN